MVSKELIDELRSNTDHVGHLDKTLFDHLWGTYLILKDQMERPEYVCIAGLMHSVYETEYFNFDTPYTREYVKSLVGEDAENLIYEFCSLKPRINCLISKTKDWNPTVYADLLDIELANMREQGYYNTEIKLLEAIRKNLK